MTMVNAPPKQTPITKRTAPGDSFDKVPPTVKIKAMAAPTYMPAIMERIR